MNNFETAPTLGVIGRPPTEAPSPVREVVQQAPRVAQPPPKFKLPPVEEMVNDYQRWTAMASDPEVAKEVAPQLQAWRNLAMQQHAAQFKGDPMASPEQAAAYARHMGQIQGQLGAPMPWEEAAKVAEYISGTKAKMPTNFMQSMNRYDKSGVQPFVDDIYGPDWQLQSLAPGQANVGGNRVDVPTITLVNKKTGETKTHNSLEVSSLFGNFEGQVKVAELNRKREIEAAQADFQMAKAQQDPVAAAAAFERLNALQGGTGGGRGGPVGASAMAHMPLVQSAIQQTGASIDPLFAISILNAESAGDPKARSPKNAQGLMQLIPATAQRFGVTNPYDPQQNVMGGVKYLDWLNKRYNGDLEKVAAAYNAGEGAVDKYGGVPPYAETRGYVQKVLKTYKTHRQGLNPNEDPAVVGARLLTGGAPTDGGRGVETGGLTKIQQEIQGRWYKERADIRKAQLGEKEEARRLAAADADAARILPPQAMGVTPQAAAPQAPPGMPGPPGPQSRPPVTTNMEEWVAQHVGA